MPKYSLMKDTSHKIVSDYGSRTRLKMKGMPVLNQVSIGCPITKLQSPSTEATKNEFDLHAKTSREANRYSYEDRFLEPLLPLVVHFYYEVLHGPDYLHTLKADRVRDTFLCLGNLKASFPNDRHVIDKLAMEYMFSGKTFPLDFESLKNEVPQEAFNYDEIKVQDKMMVSPFEVGSVVHFFAKAMIVANVETCHALNLVQERHTAHSLRRSWPHCSRP